MYKLTDTFVLEVNQSVSKLTTCLWSFIPVVTTLVLSVTDVILGNTRPTWRLATAVHVRINTAEISWVIKQTNHSVLFQ